MDLYSLLSSSLVNNSNWMRFFEDIINTEIQSLHALNLSFNRDDIDANEINIRFQLESDRLQPSNLNTNTNSNWIHFLPLEYNGTNLNEINFHFEIGVHNETTGLTCEQIEQVSTKILISTVTECHICLDSLFPNSCMRQLTVCEHKYCIDCIDQWLKHNKTCPVCKRTLI